MKAFKRYIRSMQQLHADRVKELLRAYQQYAQPYYAERAAQEMVGLKFARMVSRLLRA